MVARTYDDASRKEGPQGLGSIASGQTNFGALKMAHADHFAANVVVSLALVAVAAMALIPFV